MAAVLNPVVGRMRGVTRRCSGSKTSSKCFLDRTCTGRGKVPAFFALATARCEAACPFMVHHARHAVLRRKKLATGRRPWVQDAIRSQRLTLGLQFYKRRSDPRVSLLLPVRRRCGPKPRRPCAQPAPRFSWPNWPANAATNAGSAAGNARSVAMPGPVGHEVPPLP